MNDEDWNVYRGFIQFVFSNVLINYFRKRNFKRNRIWWRKFWDQIKRNRNSNYENLIQVSFVFLIFLLISLFLDYVSIKRADESIYGLNSTGDYIELAVERIKGPEVLFQPKIGGIDQSGLIEVINQVLKNYNSDIQKILLQNIFLTV